MDGGEERERMKTKEQTRNNAHSSQILYLV